MSVIRPENANRDGSSVPAHTPALNTSLRRLGDRADEGTRLDERRDTARDEARVEGGRETGDSARLTNLLFRAGIGATSGTINSGSAAQRVTNDSLVKVTAKTDELNLGPATAPRTELTSRLSESARSFANNVDRVFTNHLTQLRSALTAIELQPHANVPHGGLTALNAQHLADAQQLGNGDRQVQTHADIANAHAVTAGADTQQGNNRVLVHPMRLDERATPVADRGLSRIADGVGIGNLGNGHEGNGAAGDGAVGNNAAAGAGRGLNINRAPGGNILIPRDASAVAVSNGEMAKRLQLQDTSKLSSDQLLTEFLKLNINDPNANVETQNKLYELASQMRKLAIEEAQKRIQRAQELMKEAQKMADKAEKYADMASVMGIAAAFMGPMGAILSGVMQIVVAVMQYQAQMKMLDAKEEKNNAERFKLMGDMSQNQVEETGDTINKVMELKNQMVDSVIQMINASFSTQQQLMSASMAR